ncbi:MAG: hypothetical protein KAI29_17615 [Cyclobacteriaceae bacterium]|nr:hypothetical protein [Cyclobacteriaceae bacterium]
MKFYPGFNIVPTTDPMGFNFGAETFGPEVENRRLDSIRPSLMDPKCDGPEIVYSIAMDVGKKKHLAIMQKRNILFGVVTYAAGRLGKEPIRSQGHIHKKTRGNKLSPPEIYEIWSGRAIIYMQEKAKDNPGRCFAITAGPGEVVVVPPDWAHATISADPNNALTFGAWCDRDYGFDYEDVRAHRGLAWFPVINNIGSISWKKNTNYEYSVLIVKGPEDYSKLNIVKGEPIYKTFAKDNDAFIYMANPELKAEVWKEFIP